jgi:hypothetical protein
MKVSQHVKYTTIAAFILLPFCDFIQIALFFIGSILIDVDHYVFYVLQFKKWDIRGMFDYYERFLPEQIESIPYAGVCIFHTIEVFIILGIASYYYSFLFYLLMGMIFHYILDFIFLYQNKCLFSRAFSIVEHFIRAKKHRSNGYPYYYNPVQERN